MRTHNGLTELDPSVAEQHFELLREHAFPLLRRLLERIERLEESLLVTHDPADRATLDSIEAELAEVRAANTELDAEGAADDR